jgi:hypothetical protein
MSAGVRLCPSLPLCIVVLLLGFGAAAEPAANAAQRADLQARGLSSPVARLTQVDRRALLAGETVVRPMRFQQGSGQYVGGIAYQLVRASPLEVTTALLSVGQLPRLLPRTKQARLVDAQAEQARIELVQGNSLVEATYTIVLEQDRRGGLLRFWLDPSRPHDIRDVWGFFRVRPFGASQSLVTVAVALDVGDPVVRFLFEDRIQRVILSAPRQIRDCLAPQIVASAR